MPKYVKFILLGLFALAGVYGFSTTKLRWNESIMPNDAPSSDFETTEKNVSLVVASKHNPGETFCMLNVHMNFDIDHLLLIGRCCKL